MTSDTTRDDPHSEDLSVAPEEASAPDSKDGTYWLWAAIGLLIVVGLGWATRWLESSVPDWASGSSLERFAGSIEYPVYAIILGLVGSVLVTRLGIRSRVEVAFKTEFFIKTGLVLLGASINLAVIVRAAGPAIAQALILVTSVFLFTWWIAGKFGLDDKLRALLASAVSICGVSAAIAAAGAVNAKKEQLAYTASLVILFALPSIFLLPWLAGVFGLTEPVAGAWIGGNIDTTAAVAAAGAIVGEEALQIAAIVKATQNVLMGVVAVALTAYFAFKVEKSPDAKAPGLSVLWARFPKFVLGFILASVIATWYLNAGGDSSAISAVNTMRAWFLILAFVSIGLEFRLGTLREAGWRPIAVFGSATVFNLTVALLAASILFRNF